MNAPVILDTSALISLGTVTDSNYKNATTISNLIREENRTTIVPGDVFTEFVNVVGKKVSHGAAVKQATKILSSNDITIAETTMEIRKNALEKFKTQPKSVSFTDCLVMAFADTFETKDIFGFDETFRKNGYIRLGIDNENEMNPKTT